MFNSHSHKHVITQNEDIHNIVIERYQSLITEVNIHYCNLTLAQSVFATILKWPLISRGKHLLLSCIR